MAYTQLGKAEDARKKLVNEIGFERLRKIQVNMHLCAARCYDNPNDSVFQVANCVSDCSLPLEKAKEIIWNELKSTQKLYQNCVIECYRIKDAKEGPFPTESEATKYKHEWEICASKCIDKHVVELQDMIERMRELLKKV